jgi:hypothetical protein
MDKIYQLLKEWWQEQEKHPAPKVDGDTPNEEMRVNRSKKARSK